MRHLSDDDASDLDPASPHYRAYVGPPREFDLMAGLQFSLLFALGLREHHRLLDFGCGSLRAGRLLIPYLAAGGYFGLEPNAWLVEDAMVRQTGRDLMVLKRPVFSHDDSFTAKSFGDVCFDFVLAQSIFSHAGPDLTSRALRSIAQRLSPEGLVAATFIPGDEDTPNGWHYTGVTKRGTVRYRPRLICALAEEAGLEAAPIQWPHPRQQWWLFARRLPPEQARDRLTLSMLPSPQTSSQEPAPKGM